MPFKRSFNIRVGPARHRRLAIAARERGLSRNEVVATTLAEAFAARDDATL